MEEEIVVSKARPKKRYKEKIIVSIGSKFNRWTVLSDSFRKDGKGRTLFLKVECDCGKIKDVVKDRVINGRTNSCGCYRLDTIQKRTIENRAKILPSEFVETRELIPVNKIYYLYKITNNLNGKLYVGMTVNIVKRWNSHRSASSGCIKLRNAMIHYGIGNFSIDVISSGEREFIASEEKRLIGEWNLTSEGYNLSVGGEYIAKRYEKRNYVWDTPVYASGWWFPSHAKAVEVLGWTDTIIRRRKKEKNMEAQSTRKAGKQKVPEPMYYHGFWFKSADLAAKIFKKSEQSVRWYNERHGGSGGFNIQS